MTISKGVEVPKHNETALMTAIANSPLSLSVDASNDAVWQAYAGGIVTEECSTCKDASCLDHGVTGVGYGTDSSSGTDYWIIKNVSFDGGGGGRQSGPVPHTPLLPLWLALRRNRARALFACSTAVPSSSPPAPTRLSLSHLRYRSRGAPRGARLATSASRAARSGTRRASAACRLITSMQSSEQNVRARVIEPGGPLANG